jgi:hypothetical protein
VNIYYHFYSATYLSSLRALEKIHHWALGQKLHSVTALDFVMLTKDSRETKIGAWGPSHWVLENSGAQRTFRVPASAGRPDLSRCRGVTGWTEHEGQIYIHTQGLRRTEIVLAAEAAAHNPRPYLAESSATVRWREFAPRRLELEAEDLRPMEMIFGGIPSGARCDVTVNSRTSVKTSDSRGFLTLALPAKAHVILDTSRSSHAAAR